MAAAAADIAAATPDSSAAGSKRKRRSEAASPVERPSRERKSIERYVNLSPMKTPPSKSITAEQGPGPPGTMLKDIPNVFFNLSKRKADGTLQALHKILFGRRSNKRKSSLETEAKKRRRTAKAKKRTGSEESLSEKEDEDEHISAAEEESDEDVSIDNILPYAEKDDHVTEQENGQAETMKTSVDNEYFSRPSSSKSKKENKKKGKSNDTSVSKDKKKQAAKPSAEVSTKEQADIIKRLGTTLADNIKRLAGIFNKDLMDIKREMKQILEEEMDSTEVDDDDSRMMELEMVQRKESSVDGVAHSVP